MINLGWFHYFLSHQIWHMTNVIFISHPRYDIDLLFWFHMSACKPSPTPFQYNVSLIVDYDTPLVDATLYHYLV